MQGLELRLPWTRSSGEVAPSSTGEDRHDDSRPSVTGRVVFQKWRWTEITVTLGLILVVSLRKEWPMTFIAVRCPHCQSDQIIKHGKTARGTQRYLWQNPLCAKGSFLLDYWQPRVLA